MAILEQISFLKSHLKRRNPGHRQAECIYLAKWIAILAEAT